MEPVFVDIAIQNALARSEVYRTLSKSFLYPTEEVFGFLHDPRFDDAFSGFLSLRDDRMQSSRLHQCFHAVREAQTHLPQREYLEQEYNRLFAHIGSTKCPPYETEYGFDNVFQKTQTMADIAGFYSAFGLEVADTNTERVDFISTELEFMSFLLLKEAYGREQEEAEHIGICVDAQRKFLEDHLGRWVTIFSRILSTSAEGKFYPAVGKFMGALVHHEARHLAIVLNEVTAPNKTLTEEAAPFGCEGCSVNETEKSL